jgi:uncharacterized protein YfeS
MMQLYLDDPEEGLSPDTSHPEFVRICEDELFYDCTNDLAPFGNDEGADVFMELEDWYRAGAKGTLRSFLDRMLTKWSGTIPELAATDRDTINKWLADPKLVPNLLSANNVVIAVAFGQAKVTGTLDETIGALAEAALDRDAIIVEHRVRRDPSWQHAAEANAAITSMGAALEKLKKPRGG